jgi:hypothetical protein
MYKESIEQKDEKGTTSFGGNILGTPEYIVPSPFGV